jgi:hypothetical protein
MDFITLEVQGTCISFFYSKWIKLGTTPSKSCAVLGIRIRILRIRMFLGLPDPDPLVRGADPDPSLSHKCIERAEIMPAK